MTTALRFGALLLPNAPWSELVARCRRLEELGIESVRVDDHLANPARPQQSWFEAWTLLAGIAGQTTRLRLGPLVTSVVARPPALIARAALTLDQLSGGRLDLGLGAGYAPLDHELAASEVWPPPERLQRFREAVTIVDGLLRGAAFSFSGAYYSVDALTFAPQSLQRPRPPLTLAAHSRGSLAVVARFADIWNSYGGWGLSSEALLTLTRQRNEQLDELCARDGRDPRTLGRSLLAGNPAVTADPLWSSVDAFADFAGRCAEAGITELLFYYPPEFFYKRGTVDPAIVERIARELLPRLRAGKS